MSQFFGPAVHSAYVVPDVEDAVARMLAAGIGPAFYMARIRVAGRYRGERADPLITAVFMYTGNLQFEFIEQHDDTPSAYREYLDKNPAGGLHHTAYFSNNFQETLLEAEQRGTPFDVVQEFISEDGAPYEIYTAPSGAENPLYMQLMLPGPLQSMFDEMEKAAAKWNGDNPKRNALDLLPPEMVPPTE